MKTSSATGESVATGQWGVWGLLCVLLYSAMSVPVCGVSMLRHSFLSSAAEQ